MEHVNSTGAGWSDIRHRTAVHSEEGAVNSIVMVAVYLSYIEKKTSILQP